jgi:OOP family OmpA-OmpF porin
VRRSALLIAAVALMLSPGIGLAQTNPSIDEMLKSLKPTAPSTTTRGIRLAAPAPEVSLSVVFATGSAQLTPAAMQTLNDLGQVLTNPSLSEYKFRIEGHTDTVGGREMNRALSERRAASVVTYLVGKFQIDPARLQAVGMGEEGLLVPTPDQTPESRNRRVLVMNIGS